EQAARDGKVRVLPGFGAAKETKLIENIERWRRLSETVPLYVALPLAERFQRTICAFPEVRRVEICGEIRRGCDTVRGIYLLADTTNAPQTLSSAQALPGMGAVAESSSAHFVAPIENGLPLTVATYDAGLRWSAWGFAVLAATGPASFYDSLEPGDSVNKVSLATEDDVFAALNLPVIPPELRDTPGVIETVRDHGLPNFVAEADFRGQLHEHSRGSDGTATIREMAEAALARGYEYLAITDHSRSLTIANGLTRDRLEKQIDEIAELNKEFVSRGLTILTGIEADILASGAIDCEDDLLARLDIVVASVHLRYKEDAAAMTERIVRAIEHPLVHIIGHPTGRLLGRRESYPMDVDAVISAAARTGTILEINASPERLDLRDEYARKAKDAGVLLSINADAHSTGGLGLISWGITVARRAWLSPNDVVNTFPLAKLRATLKPKPV
ncbi:MAG: PHP domain-containing protein, partial [Akkermansiaceae bacterium]|nr:PHP domain-containing protein [Armatimonadota bacterium]